MTFCGEEDTPAPLARFLRLCRVKSGEVEIEKGCTGGPPLGIKPSGGPGAQSITAERVQLGACYKFWSRADYTAPVALSKLLCRLSS